MISIVRRAGRGPIFVGEEEYLVGQKKKKMDG